MPGGQFDSSKTRVVPFFKAIAGRSDEWVRSLLGSARHGHSECVVPTDCDLTYLNGEWGVNEHPYHAPKSLLRWMVQNPSRLRKQTSSHKQRHRLLQGDPAELAKALREIEASDGGRTWFSLEGTTFPDAVITTRDAVVVVEGKRTESGPTTKTSWLEGRHQMWRHIEGAWAARDGRQVFGIFMVDSPTTELPHKWQRDAEATSTAGAIASSFPHRSLSEQSELARCFRGVTTWRAACALLGVDYNSLPHTVDDIPEDV
jgi:hypothetical protein